jgi:GNAT superfamily N-acetyltransferase
MRNDILFRKATVADLKDIQRLNHALFVKENSEFGSLLYKKYPYSRAAKGYFLWRIGIRRSGFVEVALYRKKIVGYLCGGLSRRKNFFIPAKYAEIENFFVESKHRGKGIGTTLVADFIRWCKDKNVDYVSVTASVKNKNGLNLYRRFGLRDTDITLFKKIKK